MLSKLLVLTTLYVGAILADNNDPIVLVHGLGSSPDTWEYTPEIESAGLTAIAVDIGKFTSAHDRAAELYAQLKGTVVDYGVCHSAFFQHDRFGKDYTGQALFPNWNENNKIHLMGHSFGATTIVLLEKLLREGSGCAQDTSELYTGGNKNWITSITSVAGVLSGTTLLDILDNSLNFIENFVVFYGGIFDDTFLETLIDADFDHWGLQRLPGESAGDFWQRATNSRFLSEDNTDISTYDLSITGSREINAIGQLAYPETYYFAVATEKTENRQNCFFGFFCGETYQVPSLFMNLLLQPFAYQMGSLDEAPEDRENDGLVNWVNQICPIVTEADRSNCNEFDGTWNNGEWVYLDRPDIDHFGATSRDNGRDNNNFANSMKKVYLEHSARLKALP